MEQGDLVYHKKYGQGTVVQPYSLERGVRVKFDNGHETVCGYSRLKPVRQNTTKLPDPTVSTTTVRRRGTSTADIDYGVLDRARRAISEVYPDATAVIPRWYSNQAYCEVWTGEYARGGRATIVWYQGD